MELNHTLHILLTALAVLIVLYRRDYRSPALQILRDQP